MPCFLWKSQPGAHCLLQLAQAGKRMSPSDPDKSRAPSASLPFWDMLRFVWRGQIGLTARSTPLLPALPAL